MSAAYLADKGPRSIRVHTAGDDPRPVAVIRLADSGDVDSLLRAYGWTRVTPWAERGDGHAVATLERLSRDPAIEQLERDQFHGEQRRASMRDS